MYCTVYIFKIPIVENKKVGIDAIIIINHSQHISLLLHVQIQGDKSHALRYIGTKIHRVTISISLSKVLFDLLRYPCIIFLAYIKETAIEV